MITLLVAFFIMLYAMASQSPQPDGARQQFQNGVRSALLGVGEPPRPLNNSRIVVAPPVEAFRNDVAQKRLFGRMAGWIARRHLGSQVRLEAEPGGVVLRLDSGAMLFDTGTAALEPRGAEIVDALEDALAPEVVAGQVRAVRVAGHTEDQPIAPGSPWGSNWQLSSARAAGVAARLAGRGGPALSSRLEATGYGASRPVAANDNENGRRRNRRVEIRVLLVQNAPATDKENEKHHE